MSMMVLDPQTHLEYFRKIGKYPTCQIPEQIIFVYPRALFRDICAKYPNTRGDGIAAGLRVIAQGERSLGVVQGPLGAPMAALLAEQYFALGARQIVTLGTAGALNEELAVGDVVVCSEAIADEGVSRHYLGPVEKVQASQLLLTQILSAFERTQLRVVQGASWTMDAPYCETWEQVRHYRSKGVLTVEMEVAALYAVAAKRGFEALSLLGVSDRISEQGWIPGFENPKLMENLGQCFDTFCGICFGKTG